MSHTYIVKYIIFLCAIFIPHTVPYKHIRRHEGSLSSYSESDQKYKTFFFRFILGNNLVSAASSKDRQSIVQSILRHLVPVYLQWTTRRPIQSNLHLSIPIPFKDLNMHNV